MFYRVDKEIFEAGWEEVFFSICQKLLNDKDVFLASLDTAKATLFILESLVFTFRLCKLTFRIELEATKRPFLEDTYF